MGSGHYRRSSQYKRKQKAGKDSFDSFLGLLALPFLPFILIAKLFGLGRKR